MDYSIMFNVEEGGVSTPIKWEKDAFQPNRSVIVLDEGSLTLFLWHGVQQGLVARRTALRQAESLKGHGFTVGKSIVGRDIKQLLEIDARKVGRVPEETEKNGLLQAILNKEFRELDNFVVTFSVGEFDVGKMDIKTEPKPAPKAAPKAAAPAPAAVPAPAAKAEPKPEPKPAPKATPAPKSTPVPAVKPAPMKFASEYDSGDSFPDIKEEPKPAAPAPVAKPVAAPAPAVKPAAAPATEPSKEKVVGDVRIGLVLKAILDHYDDIWVSKKGDGTIAVEMMDGPICQFSIKDGKISFSQNSFTGIDPAIKTQIQQKYADLLKVL